MTHPLDDVDRVVRDAFLAETDRAFPRADLLDRIYAADGAGPVRRRHTAAIAAAAVAVVLVAAGGLMAQRDDESVTAGPPPGQVLTTLPVPAIGQAAPGQLADGTAVWVVRHDDGAVSVLDAVSAHRPLGFGALVGWCPSSRGFEDPAHGSQYDEHGHNRGGPAPAALTAFATGPVEHGTVSVTRPDSSSPVRIPGERPTGPGCFYGDAELELHSLALEPRTTLREALDDPTGDFVVIADAPIIIVDGQPAIVCDGPISQSAPPRCDGVEAPGHQLENGKRWAVLEGAFVARIVDTAVHDIAFVAEWRLDEGPPVGSPEDRGGVGGAVVPDVVGRSLSSAVEQAADAGLSLTAHEGDAAFNDAVVLAIEPEAGTQVEPGAAVGARTALPDPPLEMECPSSRHPRGRANADALPPVDGLERSAAEAEVLALRQQLPDSSDTEVFLGIWDRWAYSGSGSTVTEEPRRGFQVIVVTQDASRCPGAPQFRGVPVTYVVGPIQDWAGDPVMAKHEATGERSG